MSELSVISMNAENFDAAKKMMEISFATTMEDLPNNQQSDLPSIDGILERPEETPLLFYQDGKMVGGAVLIVNEDNNNILTLLFVDPTCFDKGIGYQAWLEIEKKYPQTKTWTTETPTFLMKNVTFYVNKCGFHIIRVNDPKKDDSMYVFQKIMKQ
ncbi:MAG: GNAT family N-acetyltransferase [Methanoregula sp.]|nr:GNAT family N-acetyltransferase [Methanoregula sp.]